MVAEVEGRVPMRGRVAILVLVLGLAVPIGSGPDANPDAEYQHGDYVTALRVLRPLAEDGDAFAQLALGFMYLNGWNTPQDYVQARKWFNLASSRSPPGADHDAALLGGNLVAAKMTPAQIDEAQTLTQEWFSDLLRRHSVRP
jgi:TPR repeat protein